MAKPVTFRQIVHRIRAGEIAPIYFLHGSDAFLQDFILKEISANFLNGNGEKKHYSMDMDSTQTLISDLYEGSLFVSKRTFIVREIKKLKSNQDDFLQYLKSPDPNICLILIDEDFTSKSKFLDKIKKTAEPVNVSPPFENKIKEWAQYILSLKEFKVDDKDLDKIIEIYGDSIASVVNEIEKISLMQGGAKQLDLKSYLSEVEDMREFFMWNLLDNLGTKRLQKSIIVFDSIIEHGLSTIQIVIQLSEFYRMIYNMKISNNSPGYSFYFNKIIKSRAAGYLNKYGKIELENILLRLRKIDMYLKTTSLKDKLLFHPLFSGICKGIYA